MSKNVLNIGAGVLPLVAQDLEADFVYNYDPLDSAKKKLDSVWFGIFLGIIRDPESDVVYMTEEDKIRDAVPDNSIDLLISISPYGFSVINEWVDAKLKSNAKVLVFGNSSNKWVNNSNNIFLNEELSEKYEAEANLNDWENLIKGKVQQFYPSQTSAVEKDTEINIFKNFTKVE